MKVYVVVEGRLDAAILGPLIAAAGFKEANIVVGGGKSAATSLANSIALSRQLPVAVIVDADTTDLSSIREQRRTFSDLQGPTSQYSKSRLFLAVPTLEEELFVDAEAFTRIFKINLTKAQALKFNRDRKAVLKSFLNIPGVGIETQIVPGEPLDSKWAKEGFGLPLLKSLFSYLKDPYRPSKQETDY